MKKDETTFSNFTGDKKPFYVAPQFCSPFSQHFLHFRTYY